MKILIVSASTRTGRLTHQAALGLHNHLKNHPEITSQLLDLKEVALPMFEESYGKLSTPSDTISTVHEILNNADAYLFVSPEYNGSYSSALKNMVDIYPKTTFANKAVGIVTISSGNLGGMRAAIQMQQLTLAVWAIPSPQMLLVSNVKDKFNEEGDITDPSFVQQTTLFLNEFLWLAKALKNARHPA